VRIARHSVGRFRNFRNFRKRYANQRVGCTPWGETANCGAATTSEFTETAVGMTMLLHLMIGS